MMMSPETYRYKHESDTYDEICAEISELKRNMKSLKKRIKWERKNNMSGYMFPTSETQLSYEEKYLIELETLRKEKKKNH